MNSALRAEFMLPVPVPFEQMEADLKSQLKKDPKNPDILYRLGRVHYLAFDMGVEVAYTFRRDEPGNNLPGQPHVGHLVEITRFDSQKAGVGAEIEVSGGVDAKGATWKVKVMSPEDRVKHAGEAHSYFKQSLARNPKSGLTWLSYGWFTRTWAHAEDLHGVRGARDLKNLTNEEALKAFQTAWKLERTHDLDRRFVPLEGPGGMVSHEAATSWLSLASQTKNNDRSTRREMERHLKRLDKLQMGAVTPLIFHLGKHQKDPVPVNKNASIAFDMAGDGSGGRWTWPEKGAVFLVWNPSGVLKNLNGSQLFGGYTWEMFWEHGFDALAILDVNRDGVLRGGELAAISGWQDLPPYGHCETKEVFSLIKLGVVALHLTSEPYAGEEALVWNPAGVELKDGTRIPLWDWLAQPSVPAKVL